jgi:hypothetical protein
VQVHSVQPISTAPVAGRSPEGGPSGARLTFPDYQLLNPWALFGMFVGGTVASVLLGWAIAGVLLRWWRRPIAVLLASQALLFGIRLVGSERDGVWVVDWLVSGATAITSIAFLYRCAARRAAQLNQAPQQAVSEDSGSGAASP